MDFLPKHLELALDKTTRTIAQIRAMGVTPETQHAYDLAVQLQQELIHIGTERNWYVYPGADHHWRALPLHETEEDNDGA